MNLILFEKSELSLDSLHLKDRRARHILEVHRANIGDQLRVGMINGKVGYAVVKKISSAEGQSAVELEVTTLEETPPAPVALRLFLALPRPKFLKRTLQTIASLGVKEIYLMNSARVEKIYWSCDQLSPTEAREAFLLGLEQSRDTILPTLHLKKLFKPFVEDELPALIRNTESFVAHPIADNECPRGRTGPLTLAIGPEGGFIPYEIDHLVRAGMTPVSLGPRILKVETAVTALISRLT